MAMALGALLLALGSAGCSALTSAAGKGDVQAVKALLDGGTPIEDRSYGDCASGVTALQEAALEGQVEMVQLLLDRGAKVNASGCHGTALTIAARGDSQEIVQLLLDRGADVNFQAAHGWNALDAAVGRNHFKMVQYLLEHGAEVSNARSLVCDRGGLNIEMCTAMQFAQLKGYTKIQRLLEQAENKEVAKFAAPSAPAQVQALPPIVTAAAVSDVDSPPAVKAQKNDNAYAVVIGIDTYRNKLPKADFASHDAKIMSDYLTKVMGYEEENVAILLNERAAKTDLEKYLEHWLPKRVEKDASVFIYYSGHGAPNPKTGDAFLVPYDGDPAFVDATGYPLKRLYEQLNKLPAKQVVVMLDSCFSGSGGRSVIAKGMRPMVISVENPVIAGGRTVVLAASAGEQVSSTYDQKSHGLLTYYFLKGLQGAADKNKDGSIELAEVFDYVKPQVERKARRDFNNEQTPQLLGNPKILSQGIRLVDRPTP
jgi:hypothetical protein